MNAWLRIILCRKLRDGSRCLKDQLEDLKHDVLEDIKRINRGNWNEVAQNGDSWEKVDGQAGASYRL